MTASNIATTTGQLTKTCKTAVNMYKVRFHKSGRITLSFDNLKSDVHQRSLLVKMIGIGKCYKTNSFTTSTITITSDFLESIINNDIVLLFFCQHSTFSGVFTFVKLVGVVVFGLQGWFFFRIHKNVNFVFVTFVPKIPVFHHPNNTCQTFYTKLLSF